MFGVIVHALFSSIENPEMGMIIVQANLGCMLRICLKQKWSITNSIILVMLISYFGTFSLSSGNGWWIFSLSLCMCVHLYVCKHGHTRVCAYVYWPEISVRCFPLIISTYFNYHRVSVSEFTDSAFPCIPSGLGL